MKDSHEDIEPEMLEPEDFNQLNDADDGNGPQSVVARCSLLVSCSCF